MVGLEEALCVFALERSEGWRWAWRGVGVAQWRGGRVRGQALDEEDTVSLTCVSRTVPVMERS